MIGPAASAAPTDTGGGSAYVTSTFNVTPLQGIQAAAPAGTPVNYVQGLPTDTSLSPIPSSDISPAYMTTGYGGTYTGTLTAPETGTYVLAFQNPGSYTATYLSLNGKEILANPGTPPTSTYSVAVNLTAGQQYTLTLNGGGPSANLSWATPSDLAPVIAQAVAAAKAAATAVVVVSDDTESEAADRAGLNLPSAQDELISAVAAVNPHTVVVVNAGAPVAMPWLKQVAAVVDAWYPGESNGTALAAVLFGQVDPGGHLPVTFPQSLSQVPASSPSQFPGVNGQVNYSEGIDVGYRYYDANNETPLFPFGYGLSYTKFRFSNLMITPASVQNSSSSPGATSCHCNGQSGSQVTVSATVTNTGKVAGSDVAQLYLGDPSVAGEPPRQLKGFDNVELQPGQSQTVSFKLNGHDLSYWDDAADGWVLPDGDFHVYVGDSSALDNLPLKGGFNVTRTVGARYVNVNAPDTVDAGKSAIRHRDARQRRRLRDAKRAVHAQGAARLDREQSRSRQHRRGPDGHQALQGDRPLQRRARDAHAHGHGHSRQRDAGDRRIDDDRRAVCIGDRRLQQHRDQRQLRRERGQLRRGRRQLLRAGAGGRHAACVDARRHGDDRRHDVHVAKRARRHSGQHRRRRPDGRSQRRRNRPRIPRLESERDREWDRHDPLHGRQQPVVQPQHGRLVRQRAGRRQPASHHHLELELPEQPARCARRERVLRVVAAGAAARRSPR